MTKAKSESTYGTMRVDKRSRTKAERRKEKEEEKINYFPGAPPSATVVRIRCTIGKEKIGKV